jgi:hypothetical protein
LFNTPDDYISGVCLKIKKTAACIKKKEIEQLNKAAIKNRKNKHGPQFLGIGALRSYSSWDNIKEYAETQGIYTALDLRKIIHDNSPIKKIGDHKFRDSKNDRRCSTKEKRFKFPCCMSGKL